MPKVLCRNKTIYQKDFKNFVVNTFFYTTIHVLFLHKACGSDNISLYFVHRGNEFSTSILSYFFAFFLIEVFACI